MRRGTAGGRLRRRARSTPRARRDVRKRRPPRTDPAAAAAAAVQVYPDEAPVIDRRTLLTEHLPQATYNLRYTQLSYSDTRKTQQTY